MFSLKQRHNVLDTLGWSLMYSINFIVVRTVSVNWTTFLISLALLIDGFLDYGYKLI